jgi:predicted nuclease with TOPRIM domain
LLLEFEEEKSKLMEEKNKKVAELQAIQQDLEKIDYLIRNSTEDRNKVLANLQSLQTKQLPTVTEQVNTLRDFFGIT